MKSVVIGTAGHIDHGKSALVRALTGTDPDRLTEEKARGITIDLGFAHLAVDDVALAFVDVPGHERFVRNMLAGAGGIDAVMLVIAADESVMPQTREHFQICRLLEVPAGLIVLTKSDLADAEMRELTRMEARELVAGSFLDGAPIVEVSAKTGEGLDALTRALRETARGAPSRGVDGPARLPIDRVFSVKGFGTVVTGTLVAGVLTPEQECALLPRGRDVKVRGLQVHGTSAQRAEAGQRVAVNLGGVEVADVTRGDTLGSKAAFEPTRRVDVTLDMLEGVRALKHGARIRFHQGTTELFGRVAVAAPRDGVGDASEVAPGASAFGRIRLEAPAVLTRGDRFIIRAYSPVVTIGGGVVMDPDPPRGAIRTPAGVARLRRLDPMSSPGPDAAVLQFLGEAGAAGLSRSTLVVRGGLSPVEADALVRQLAGSGAVCVLDDLLVLPGVLDALAERLLGAITAHHSAEPLSGGLPREEARERLFDRASPVVFEHVLARLEAARRIVARDRLALAGHELALSSDEAAARDILERIYRDAGLAPPELTAAATGAGVAPAVAERVGRLLVRQKALVKLEGLLFHAEALALLKGEVRALKEAGSTPRVDVAAFKARYGISRKFAIPLLEYLDRERVTRRIGDVRVVI
ncbi:selenocysteine-specific translation elongation factor [soil metagenome]|nr:selenocysteine-specific translation elongation factor [Acidobacteriota bacterium]